MPRTKPDAELGGATASWKAATDADGAQSQPAPMSDTQPVTEEPKDTPLKEAEHYLERRYALGDAVGWRTILPQGVRDTIEQSRQYVADHPDATDKSVRVRVVDLADKLDAREKSVMNERATQQAAIDATNEASAGDGPVVGVGG